MLGVVPSLSLVATNGGREHPDTTVVDSTTKIDVASHVWTMAAIYGLGGIVLLSLLVFVPTGNTLQAAMLAVMTVLVFIALGVSLYSIYGMGKESQNQRSSGTYACKYCGKRFANMTIWRKHQQSCVEMKL